ncbi:hypothetical protein A3860_38020 [Niastella vici]|uniref:HTH luxR-type domain-containing protein n=1 Tax=Niastella vici TaxID=1703345 RepID=A0A1V9FLN0_9BACT|nr:sigma-70 family RNA polymerase sigma factor [Niastella vici]OQP59254.1 hypothetical protein A3860_38020 [Niastella vici]
MTQLSSEQLIEFSQGNPKAFEAVFNCFRMRIFYFVKKLIDDKEEAEEITSETFVKLYRIHDKFNTFNNIQAFLFITARNASLNFLRYRKRQQENKEEFINHEEQEIDAAWFAETDIKVEILKRIYEEVEELPDKCKEIFKLAYLKGYSITQIAEKLNISRQTVSNQKTTAIKKLQMKFLDRPDLFLWMLYFLSETRH